MDTSNKLYEIVNAFNSGPKGREETRSLVEQLESLKNDPEFAAQLKELKTSNPEEANKIKECLVQALLHTTKLVGQTLQDMNAKAKVAADAAKVTATALIDERFQA